MSVQGHVLKGCIKFKKRSSKNYFAKNLAIFKKNLSEDIQESSWYLLHNETMI